MAPPPHFDFMLRRARPVAHYMALLGLRVILCPAAPCKDIGGGLCLAFGVAVLWLGRTNGGGGSVMARRRLYSSRR